MLLLDRVRARGRVLEAECGLVLVRARGRAPELVVGPALAIYKTSWTSGLQAARGRVTCQPIAPAICPATSPVPPPAVWQVARLPNFYVTQVHGSEPCRPRGLALVIALAWVIAPASPIVRQSASGN